VKARVLVTGGSGFIGRRLVQSLKLDDASISAPGSDVLDVTAAPFPDFPVDQVVHLAARTYVPDAWTDPADFYRVNTQGTINVLDFCRRTGSHLIFVSGYCYGIPVSLPLSESAPVRPNNPYAFSKYAAEQACRFFHEFFQTHVTILRPFNIYGPGQSPHFLIPRIVEQAVDSAVSEIVVEDDKPRRDYVHVDDVVGAIRALLKNPRPGATFNVGAGESHSVAELAKLICSAANVEKPLVSRARPRSNEIPDVVADISAIRHAIGWSPSVSLQDGLRGIVAQYRDRSSAAVVEAAAGFHVPKSGNDQG
jgi:nucleoside-diphosphate-sugar epimerase